MKLVFNFIYSNVYFSFYKLCCAVQGFKDRYPIPDLVISSYLGLAVNVFCRASNLYRSLWNQFNSKH